MSRGGVSVGGWGGVVLSFSLSLSPFLSFLILRHRRRLFLVAPARVIPFGVRHAVLSLKKLAK